MPPQLEVFQEWSVLSSSLFRGTPEARVGIWIVFRFVFPFLCSFVASRSPEAVEKNLADPTE